MESFHPFFTANTKEHAVQCSFSDVYIYLCFSLLETVDEDRCSWQVQISSLNMWKILKRKFLTKIFKNSLTFCLENRQ